MMRYVRAIDKTTKVATPRGVTPCSSDKRGRRENDSVLHTHVKVFTCRTYSPTEPSNFKFSWFRLQYRCYASLRELPVVTYNSSFPSLGCHVSERTLSFVVIVLFQIMILSSSSQFKRYRCRDVCLLVGFHLKARGDTKLVL